MYVDKVQKIAARKLALYKEMEEKLNEFKRCLREEEEVHRETVSKNMGFGIKGAVQ
jgi:hypothetical protein